MNYSGDLKNVSDEYLRRVFYHSYRLGMEQPVYQIHYEDSLDSIESKNKFVLMITGNENHKNLDHFYQDSRVLAVVKNYPYIKNEAPPDRPDIEWSYSYSEDKNGRICFETSPEDPRTINIPLGYCNGYSPRYLVQKPLPGGFLGQWSENRQKYISAIDSFFENASTKNPFQFGFYKGFGPFVQGEESLTIDEYSSYMSRCQIAFCFTGQSPETFRLLEAAKAGCLLVSTPLPDTWYYRDLPAFVSPSFTNEEMAQIIEKVNLHGAELQQGIAEWYNTCASPIAVGQKIASHIKGIS